MERLREALWEFIYLGRSTYRRPSAVVIQQQKQSYREALMPEQPHETRKGDSGMEAQRGATARKGNGHGAGRVPCTAQRQGGGGRPTVGMTVGDVHSTLMDVKAQLVGLQFKVDWLIRCVEDKGESGVGLERRGLSVGL